MEYATLATEPNSVLYAQLQTSAINASKDSWSTAWEHVCVQSIRHYIIVNVWHAMYYTASNARHPTFVAHAHLCIHSTTIIAYHATFQTATRARWITSAHLAPTN